MHSWFSVHASYFVWNCKFADNVIIIFVKRTLMYIIITADIYISIIVFLPDDRKHDFHFTMIKKIVFYSVKFFYKTVCYRFISLATFKITTIFIYNL